MAHDSLQDFDCAKAAIDALRETWGAEIAETERRRRVRYHRVSVDELRRSGRLKPHETYIPVRVSDTNIKREQPMWVGFVKDSPRIAVFNCVTNRSKDTTAIETEFTTFVKYEGWEIPFFKAIDGAQTHGTDFIETVFDPSKPGHFANVHLGHDRVLYPEDTEDLQKAEYIVVDTCFSKEELRAFVETNDGWDGKAINEVLDYMVNSEDVESVVRVDKIYFKEDGCVYVAFHHDRANEWLCKPKKLYYGKIADGAPSFETEYPITCFRYSISEDGRLINAKGRVFYDEPVQDAASTGMSEYFNSVKLSNMLMICPDVPGDAAPKQNAEVIKDGAVWNQKMNFFRVPPPPGESFTVVQSLISMNEAEQSQPNFAVNNRKDSRKTATEISTATQQGAQMSSTQVTMLGLSVRDVLRRDFGIVKSQVEQGLVTSSCTSDYAETYIILPSGDADVIRRQERQLKMRQDWPVISAMAAQMGIPELALEFLFVILRESYPDMAERLIAIVKTGDIKGNLLAQIPQMLEGLAAQDPNVAQALAPHAQMLQGVKQQIEAALKPQTEGKPQESADAPEISA